MAAEGKSPIVVGGGFIGSEFVAALNINKLNVTTIFPDTLVCDHVFPDYLGNSVQRRYLEMGVKGTGAGQTCFFQQERC